VSRQRRSAISVLLARRDRLKARLIRIAGELVVAQDRPDHQLAKGGTILTPCAPECAACVSVRTMFARERALISTYKKVLREIADCTELTHRKRLRGAQSGVARRKASAQQLEDKVREALRRGQWNPRQRGISKRIATDVGASVRTVQRFLRILSA